MLTKLSKFFTMGLGTVNLFGQFDNTAQNLAHFKTLIPHIDRVLYHDYGDELARGTPDEITPLISDFMQFVLSWWTMRIEDLNRIYDASIETYNPLDNYTMTEETATARKRGEIENSTDADIKPRVSTNYTSTNDDKTTGRMESYTVAGILQSGMTPNTNGTENTKTKSKYNDEQTLSTDNLSVTGNEVETIEHKRNGNIGTVTAQDMLNQEYDVRERGFIIQFCKLFERECLTGLFAVGDNDYCGGF